MFKSLMLFSTLLFYSICAGSVQEKCVTPNKQEGDCISLFSCSKLLSAVNAKQPGAVEFVKQSNCGGDVLNPLVCCGASTEQKCLTPNKEEGDCISLFSCTNLLSALIAKQPGSVEFVKQSNCGGDVSNPLVCCGPSSNFTQLKDDKNVTHTKDDKMKLLADKSYCGYQHSDDLYPAVDNFTARITEFPWLAGILYRNPYFMDSRIYCVGTLINKRYVLTAAQCGMVYSFKPELVILGEFDTKKNDDCVHEMGIEECSEPVQVYGIEKAIIHPLFKPEKHYSQKYLLDPALHDIALIRLNASIRYFNDYIRPICLPFPGTKLPQPGDILQSPAWDTRIPQKNEPIVKRKIYSTLVTNEECAEGYKHYNITKYQICYTGHVSVGNLYTLCEEDQGAPVMYSSGKPLQWHLEGINSYGVSCGPNPGVYTSVRNYLDWILENIER